ncbi:MAG: hypothetical protein ACI8TQ_002065 [Planctomycetota bacterium]
MEASENGRGHFDSDTCPRLLRCVLEPALGVSGIFTIDDQPVSGVKVVLFSVAPRGSSNSADGFPTRFQGAPAHSTTTDETGAFLLMASENNDYVVRSEAPAGTNRAAFESNVFTLDVRKGHSGIRLEPEQSAAVLVVVRTLPGRDKSGIIVGITDGGADTRTKRTESDATVEFTGLRAASWRVSEKDRELSAGSNSYSSAEVCRGV